MPDDLRNMAPAMIEIIADTTDIQPWVDSALGMLDENEASLVGTQIHLIMVIGPFWKNVLAQAKFFMSEECAVHVTSKGLYRYWCVTDETTAVTMRMKLEMNGMMTRPEDIDL